MKKIKALALVMAVAMLQPLLMSCSANKNDAVVKEDDPWYESTRFELDSDKNPTEMLEGTAVSYSNGKVFHIYSLVNLADMDNFSRKMIDVYDVEGNLSELIKITDP